MNISPKTYCIGVTCTRRWDFEDTFSQSNSCWIIETWPHDRKQMWSPTAYLRTFFFMTACPCVAVLVFSVTPWSAIRTKCTTTRIRRTPIESCLYLQRDLWCHCWRRGCLRNDLQFPVSPFTHWGREKMDAISQTTLSIAFSWMKMLEFRLNFHWSLFPRVQLTISQHWFR